MKTIELLTGIMMLGAMMTCHSCSKKKSNTKLENVYMIAVPEPTPKGNADSLFSHIEFIALESNEHSMLGQIGRIGVYENYLYIFDTSQKHILKFNDQGKFEYKIGHKGKGPGEYISMLDFDIDIESGNLAILCDRPRKILLLDKNGLFINDIPLATYYREIKIVDGAILVNTFDGKYNIVCLNKETGEETARTAECSDLAIKYPSIASPFPTMVTSEKSLFCDYFDNTIYQLGQFGAEPRFMLDFKIGNLPIELVDMDLKGNEIYNFCKKQDFGFAVSNIYESSNSLFFTYGVYNYIAFYNKSNGVCQSYKEGIYDAKSKVYLSSFYAPDGDGNYMINIVNHVMMQLGLDYLRENTQNANLKTILQNLKPDDNPIIAKCYFN